MTAHLSPEDRDEWSERDLRVAIQVSRRLARSLPEPFMRQAAAMTACELMDELDAITAP